VVISSHASEQMKHVQAWLTLKVAGKCLTVFAANVGLAMAEFTNGCGNYFALGTSYGDTLQECESLLQKWYRIDYFSQSSPVVFDDLIAVLLINFVLFCLFIGFRTKSGVQPFAFWMSALLGVIAPRVVF
jgi:hypothetical protein